MFVGAPVSHEHGEGVEVVAESAGHGGRDEIGGANPTANLNRALAEFGEVGGVAEIVGQGLDGGAGRLGQILSFLERGPGAKDRAAFLHANAVAHIVAEYDIEAGHQDMLEKVGQAAEFRVLTKGQHEAVVDVAVENELIGRVALIERDDLVGPGGHGGGGRVGFPGQVFHAVGS